jgi:hypothetical protein
LLPNFYPSSVWTIKINKDIESTLDIYVINLNLAAVLFHFYCHLAVSFVPDLTSCVVNWQANSSNWRTNATEQLPLSLNCLKMYTVNIIDFGKLNLIDNLIKPQANFLQPLSSLKIALASKMK